MGSRALRNEINSGLGNPPAGGCRPFGRPEGVPAHTWQYQFRTFGVDLNDPFGGPGYLAALARSGGAESRVCSVGSTAAPRARVGDLPRRHAGFLQRGFCPVLRFGVGNTAAPCRPKAVRIRPRQKPRRRSTAAPASPRLKQAANHGHRQSLAGPRPRHCWRSIRPVSPSGSRAGWPGAGSGPYRRKKEYRWRLHEWEMGPAPRIVGCLVAS